MALSRKLTNGFDTSTIGDPKYAAIWGKLPGQPATAINPATNKRENLVQGEITNPYFTDDPWGTAGGQERKYQEYGFLSDNPDFAWSTPMGPEKEMAQMTGLGKIFSNPASYLAVLGGGVAAGLAGGAAAGAEAGAGGAFDMGVGSQGWMDYLGSQAGGSTELIGGAGQDLLGENMSYDDVGMPDYNSPQFDLSTQAPPSNLQDTITKLTKMPGGSSLVSRFLNGTATSDDYLSAGGKLLATALGVYGANKQAGDFRTLANTYDQYGAPSRARFEASMTPGFDPNMIPGYKGAVDTAMKAMLAKLSAGSGNPFGNPGGLIDANKQIISGTALPAIQEFQRLNANTGFGSSMNGALNLNTQAIGADAGSLNALGYGLNQATQPQRTLKDIMESLNMTGLA